MNNEPPFGNNGTPGQAGLQDRLQAFVVNPAEGRPYADRPNSSGTAVLAPNTEASSLPTVDTQPAMDQKKEGLFGKLARILIGRGNPDRTTAPVTTPDTQLNSTQQLPIQATDQLQVIQNPGLQTGQQTAPFSLNQTQEISKQKNPTDRLPNMSADQETGPLPGNSKLTNAAETGFKLPELPDDPITEVGAKEKMEKWLKVIKNANLKPLIASSLAELKKPDVLKKIAIQTSAGMAAGAGIRLAFAAAGAPGFLGAALASGALKGAVYAAREADKIHAAEGRKIENKNLKDVLFKRFTELPREKRSQVYKAALRGAVEGIIWNIVGATAGHEIIRLLNIDTAIGETIDSIKHDLFTPPPSGVDVNPMTGQILPTATPTPSAMESWAKIPTVTPAAEDSIVSNNVAKLAEHFNPSNTPEAISTPTPAEIMAQPTATPTPTVESSFATPNLTPTGTETITPTFTPSAELTPMDSMHSSLTPTPTPTAELPTANPAPTATEIQPTLTPSSTATETLTSTPTPTPTPEVASTPTLTNDRPGPIYSSINPERVPQGIPEPAAAGINPITSPAGFETSIPASTGTPPVDTNPILTPTGVEAPTLAPHAPETPLTPTPPTAEATIDTQINLPGGMDHPIATAAPTETTHPATAETPAASQATIGPDLSPRQKAAEYLLNIKQTELPVPGGGPSTMAQKFITDMIGAENAAKIPEENMQEYIKKVAYQIAADNSISVPEWNLAGTTNQFQIPVDKQMIISNETRNILSQIMDNALPANK